MRCQRNWFNFFVMEAYIVKTMERLNFGESKTTFRNFSRIVPIGLTTVVANFGQSNFVQSIFELWVVIGVVVRCCALLVWTLYRRRRTAQNFALFFPLPPPPFRSFSSLSGCLLVEFWWCLKSRDPRMCTFGVLGLSLELNKKFMENLGLSCDLGLGPPFGPTMTHTHQIQNWIGPNWIGQNCIGQNCFWPKLAGQKPRWPKRDWPKSVSSLTTSRRKAWQEEETKNTSILYWFVKSNLVPPSSSGTVRTQSYWSFFTRQCYYPKQLLPEHLSCRMRNQFTFHHQFGIDTWRAKFKQGKTDGLVSAGGTKIIRFLIRSTWMHRVMHNTCMTHGRDIRTQCIGSTSILLWGKDWSSIRLDRTLSFFTKHFKLICSKSC